ncbi:MAG: peptidylprolyl isomerase [Pseudomonadota bacterium]
MKKASLLRFVGGLSIYCLAVSPINADNVVEDKGVSLSSEELTYIIERWSPDMREAAMRDPGDRIELLNIALATKKLAASAAELDPETDPDAYWRLQLAIRNLQSQHMVKEYLANIEIPDMSALAAERYETQKDRYALVPEKRYSSHLILRCAPGACDRDARRPEAAAILAELEAGADFRELVEKYSEDPKSKAIGGTFDRWLELGMPNVDAHYIGAVFNIDEVGGHSPVVDTKFGLHIVQLDDVKPAHHKPFEEVKDDIISALSKQYIELSAKDFDSTFRMSEDTFIDDAAVEEILIKASEPKTAQQQ